VAVAPPVLLPRALPPGGTVGLAAPAGPVDPDRLEAGCRWLEDAGFQVVRRDDLIARRGYLAGDDARRAKELMELVSDDRVEAILCARGGYGCHRVVPLLDAEAFRAARKPLAGFSDVTTLLLWQLRRAGLAGFHGPMPARTATRPEDREALVRLLCGEPGDAVLRGTPGGGGRAEGPLVGGNLTVLVASLACDWEPDLEGAILLVEDVGERPYRLDRALAQLRAAGRLDGLAGVGVGSFAACDDEAYPSPTACEVVEEALRPLGVPLVLELPFGHGEANRPWPVGVRARIDGDAGTVEWLSPGVAFA
jgi:muramoyltetrapeptide carboxypeptidase